MNFVDDVVLQWRVFFLVLFTDEYVMHDDLFQFRRKGNISNKINSLLVLLRCLDLAHVHEMEIHLILKITKVFQQMDENHLNGIFGCA